MAGSALGPLVRAVICDDGLIKTHRVVKLLINAASKRLTQLEIVGERAFPVDMPVGPGRRPVPSPGGTKTQRWKRRRRLGTAARRRSCCASST